MKLNSSNTFKSLYLFKFKNSLSKFLKSTFFNMYISYILLSKRFNSFNSLKLVLLKGLIYSISLKHKSNVSNFLKLTFSNTSISFILFPERSNSFNSLKFTFSNIFISIILLQERFNFSNFLKLIFYKLLIINPLIFRFSILL